jgi:hypothetical protein
MNGGKIRLTRIRDPMDWQSGLFERAINYL